MRKSLFGLGRGDNGVRKGHEPLARRLNGKYIAPEAKHLTERVREISEGEFNQLLEDVMQKPVEELKELYNHRDIEK